MQIREVPKGTDQEQYKYGIVIGPPDLSSLGHSPEITKKLNNGLVKSGIVCYEDTKGRRGTILDLIAKTTGKKDKEALKQLLILFQEA